MSFDRGFSTAIKDEETAILALCKGVNAALSARLHQHSELCTKHSDLFCRPGTTKHLIRAFSLSALLFFSCFN